VKFGRSDSDKALISIVCVLIAVCVFAFRSYDDCGRRSDSDCAGGARLWTPGKFSQTWKIKEWRENSYIESDGTETDTSDWWTVKEFKNESDARRACETGSYR